MEKEILKEKRLSARALIESARQCVGHGNCIACDFCDDEYCDEAMKLALADKLEELLVFQEYEEGAGAHGVEWIPCEVALPAEADEYLVVIAGATSATVLYYDPSEGAFYEEDLNGEVTWYSVSYWAELPEGPNETPSADGYTSSDGFAATFPSRGRLSGENTGKVRRCATCRHEDRLGDEERCIECEKHSLWEQR